MSNLLTNSKYVSGKDAKELLKVSDNTLRKWANTGKINYIRNGDKGKRFYDINSIFTSSNVEFKTTNQKRTICYCRVSTIHQKDDLQRQKDFMREKYPNAFIIEDIGSGINWKRKGLQSLIQQVEGGKVEKVIIAYKDRLCRFAYDLIEYIFTLHKTEIVVLNSVETQQGREDIELADDILSIIHVFSCKKMGKRKYKRKEGNSNEINEDTAKTNEETANNIK
jgi:predicted site-specific integrase-resolvase